MLKLASLLVVIIFAGFLIPVEGAEAAPASNSTVKVAAVLQGTPPNDVAETVPGESTAILGKLAGELGIDLTIPFVEVDPKTGRFFNTVMLASPKGELLLHYRKLNPWMRAESGWTAQGDRGLQYVDTRYGRLGLLICYDINFEASHLKEAGIDTLLYSIAWVDETNSNWFQERLPKIASQNDFNIIGANWSFRYKPQWAGYGHSLVIDRTGKTLAKAPVDIGDGIVYADLPLPFSGDTVRVLDGSSGKPIAGASVVVIHPSGAGGRFLTDEDGIAQIQGGFGPKEDGINLQVSAPGLGGTSVGLSGVVTNHVDVTIGPFRKMTPGSR